MDAAALKQLESKLAADQAELAANLEAVRRVKKLLEAAGDVAPAGTPQQIALPVEGAPSNGAHQNPKPKLGDVDEAVRWAVGETKGLVFTSSDLEELLATNGKKCNRSSISAAVGRMRDKGQIVVVEQGQGRRATKYKRP